MVSVFNNRGQPGLLSTYGRCLLSGVPRSTFGDITLEGTGGPFKG